MIHDWDIRSGGTGEAHLDAEGVIALLPGSQMWYDLCFRPTDRLSEPIVYRFKIGSEAEGADLQHDVTVFGDHFTVEPPGGRTPALTISSSAEAYLLSLYGRSAWLTAAQSGRLTANAPAGAIQTPETPATLQESYLTRFGAWFGGL